MSLKRKSEGIADEEESSGFTIDNVIDNAAWEAPRLTVELASG
ncbi:hypothetical protein [Lyngbya sp. CCY1209]|jgi:hypothetical protein|nr:hypothetical protein [Lyngbya sp. CCY1209]